MMMRMQFNRQRSEEEVVLKTEQEKQDLEAGKMRVIDKDFYDFAMDADQCFFEVHQKVNTVRSALISYIEGSIYEKDKDSVIGGCECVLNEVITRLDKTRMTEN